MKILKRPWGWMVLIFHVRSLWVKLIRVYPGQRNSDQLHARRSEIHIKLPWIFPIKKIPPFTRHRMTGGWYIEIAYGEPLEEDIIRYHDDHGRIAAGGKVVAVSGGFDPVHIGHVRMFQVAKVIAGPGGKLIVIANCDDWLVRKKGKAFMREDDRAEIITAFACVDEVYIHQSERSDVSEALEKLKPHIFANGGDRRSTADIPEAIVCEKYNIEMIFNVGQGGKVRSSSELLKAYNGET